MRTDAAAVWLAAVLQVGVAQAVTHTLRLADALVLARTHSPEGRRVTLEARRDLLRADAGRMPRGLH